jgi:hypothetical protein
MKGFSEAKMFTITLWFYCSDCLGIQHEVVRTFTGPTEIEVAEQVRKFKGQLSEVGWVVFKCVKERLLER